MSETAVLWGLARELQPTWSACELTGQLPLQQPVTAT